MRSSRHQRAYDKAHSGRCRPSFDTQARACCAEDGDSGVSSFGFSGTIAHAVLGHAERVMFTYQAAKLRLRRQYLPWTWGCVSRSSEHTIENGIGASVPITQVLLTSSTTTPSSTSPEPPAAIPAAAMSTAELRSAVRAIVQDLVDPGTDLDAEVDTPLEALGLDSLAMLTLRDEVEAQLAIHLDTRVVLDATIGRLVAHALERNDAQFAAKAAAADAAEGLVSPDAFQHSCASSGYKAMLSAARTPKPSRWFPLPAREQRPLIMVCTCSVGSSLLSDTQRTRAALRAAGLFLLPYSNLAERRRDLEANLLFLSDGLHHTIAHLWSTDLDGARKIALEWEERSLPIQVVYSLLQQRCAPRILVDRGTENARFLDVLRRAPRMFEDLRVVQLCRHPYSVLSSGGALLRRTALARRVVSAADVAHADTDFEVTLSDYIDATWAACHSNMLEWADELDATRAAAAAAAAATSATCSAPASPSPCSCPCRPHRIKFEDLVERPEPTLRAACAALGLPFDPAMLRPYDQPANIELHSASGEAGVSARDPKLMSHTDRRERQQRQVEASHAAPAAICAEHTGRTRTRLRTRGEG